MKFDFVKHRYWFFALSLLLILPGLISIAVQGFNLGIDFTGGTLLDLKFSRPVTVAEVREALTVQHLEGSTIQLAATGQVESAQNVFIRTHVLTEEERRDALKALESRVGAFDILRIEKVGAVIGSELTRQALLSVAAASLLIIAYVSYRFEYKFAIAGVAALLHDVLLIMGVFSIFRIEVDSNFIAAVLTIIGYSINDTIVIFDRIRENLKFYRKSDGYAALVNRSIWQTMTRSIYTVLTVLFATAALYVFGGETTKNFSLALLIGFFSGAYSSVCNASQIWVTWKEYEERRRTEKKIKGNG